MNLTKATDKGRVEMTPEEEAAIREEWNRQPYAEEWLSMIQSRADTELLRGVSVTVGETTYRIRTGAMALALIGAGSVVAARARAAGTTVTEKVPTDKGIVAFDGDGLDVIFEATRARRAVVMDRAQLLHGMVADGTITEDDLNKGWS